MELGEYISNGFNKMFKTNIFWPVFVLNIFVLIGESILLAIIGASLVATLLSSAVFRGMLGNLETSLMQNPNMLASVFSSIGVGIIILVIVLLLLMNYLGNVLMAFVLYKLNNKKEGFFTGLGSSFGKGFSIFIASTVYFIILGIITLILSLLFFIPILGIILGIIYWLFLTLFFLPSSMMTLIGFTYKEGIGKGISQAFILPFRKPKLLLYGLVFAIIVFVFSLILGVISLIPIIGTLVSGLFVVPTILIFLMSIANNISKE